MQPVLPTAADIAEAARRLAGVAVRTPLLRSPALDARCGATVLLKPETLQRIGAFKFRGAYNKIAQLDRARYPGGVVACSSGNHALGVAAAARLLGVPARLVMPMDAPQIKRDGTRALGGEVHLYDRVTGNREAIASELAAAHGALLVPPFDDFDVIAGQGTVGLELAADARSAGLELDAVLVPCSGGGLICGTALAVRDAFPLAAIHPVEPEGFDDMARSLRAGERLRNAASAGSICDALMAPSPGLLPFAIAARHLASGLVVSDAQVRAAMRFAFEELKLVVEPGGAAALAALLAGKIPARDRTIAIVLSGGNVDPIAFGEVLRGE
jgi:threonine dehydratase